MRKQKCSECNEPTSRSDGTNYVEADPESAEAYIGPLCEKCLKKTLDHFEMTIEEENHENL